MRKALVLGGTEDHVRLITLLKERGFYTILMDYYPNPPAARYADEHLRESALDREKALEIARSRQVDLTIALCIDQAILTMAYVSEQMGTPCYLNHEQALSFTNKSFMKVKMAEGGIPTSKFLVLRIGDAAKEACRDLSFPVVVKPVDSNGSKGVTRVDDPDDLEPALKRAFDFTHDGRAIVEEFVEGDEYSIELFLRDGEPVLISHSRTEKTDLHRNLFVTVSSCSPSGLEEKDEFELLKIGRAISTVFSYPSGPLLVQCLKQRGRLSIIEFSARIGGGSKHHFVKHDRGCDYLDYLVRFALGESMEPVRMNPAGFHTRCHFVYARPGVIGRVDGIDRLLRDERVKAFYHYKSEGMVVTDNNSSAHRVLGFIVQARDSREVAEATRLVDAGLAVLDPEGRDLMIHDLYRASE